MRKIKTQAGKNHYTWDYQEFMYLVNVLKQAKDFREVLHLFIDLHTHQEISEIIRRVIIASDLYKGMTYAEISEESGASSGTISKVQQKFYRQKSVISDVLKRAGTYEDFQESKIDRRDPLTRYIDNTLWKHFPKSLRPKKRLS